MISFLFLLLIGAFKALSDLSSEGKIYPKSQSWKNKWRLDQNGNIIPNYKKPWYYLWLYKPTHVERFPYSSTFLVSLTDFWHKTELMRSICQVCAILFYSPFQYILIDASIMFSCYMIGFTIVYEPIKRSKM